MKNFFEPKIKAGLKIIDRSWFYPVVLFLVGLAAYGIIFTRPGFYWDDWETVYLYKLHSVAASFAYYTGRPLSALPNIIMFSLLKMTPAAWQFGSLILRWLGILFIYFTLNAIWPARTWLNRWVGVFLFVFPGYLDQVVAVCFSRHLSTFLFFTCSLFLTVLAIKNRKFFWLWMPLSVLLGITQLFMLEYFALLEIIRPLIIWFFLRSQGEEKKKALTQTLLYWSPFVIGFLGYVWWRLFYLPTTLLNDPNAPALLHDLLSSPKSTLVALFGTVYQDIVSLLISFWTGTLALDKLDIINSKISRISWFLGIVTAFFFYLYIRRSQRDDKPAGDHAFRQMLGLGSIALIAGAIPVWITARQIADGKWSDRFSLGPMLGAVILLVYLLDWLLRTRNQKQGLFLILLAASISLQVYKTNEFRLDWTNQQGLYWQLSWRIPNLKPGTAIIGSGTFTDKSSFYDGGYIVNLLFSDNITTKIAYFDYFDIWHLPASRYKPNSPLVTKVARGPFKGSTSQAIGMYFNIKNPNECVRILDPVYAKDPKFIEEISNIIPISNPNTITMGENPRVPDPDIFGTEPAHNWCYFFEKADLARQMKDWETILQLGDQANAKGLRPVSGSEYLPFIEAYAQTGQWSQAQDLSLAALKITPGLEPVLCNNWDRFQAINGGADKVADLAKATSEFCQPVKTVASNIMQLYAQIAVNVPTVSGVFDYHLPEHLVGKLGPGHLVTIPFGKQTVQGVVLGLVNQPAVAETKPILDLLDPLPVLTGVQIELARAMAESTLNPLAAMIDLMLPTGLSQQADQRYEIKDPQISANRQWSGIQARIIKLLSEKGPLRGRQIDRHFSKVDWRKAAQYMLRGGVLISQSVLPPITVRPKFVRTAQLAVALDVAEQALPDLGKTEATRIRRQAALRLLMREPDAVNVAWIYAESGCNISDLQVLDERGLIILRETEIWRDPLGKIESYDREKENDFLLVLTPDQQKAWDAILTAYQSFSPKSPFLLHGVTGSGKTELYLRATAEAIRRGRQAIILVPEIAITPQMVRRFLVHFPGQVGLVHSRLSPGEQYDTWRRARLGLLKVIIGPRSALFAPLPAVGLIVADECHDGSYYQSEPPFYNSVEAAKVYARLSGAICILGSATPTIQQHYQAEGGESLSLDLPKRIQTTSRPLEHGGLPPVSVIDMREELKSGRRGIFSQALVDALENVLKRGQQAILFLNRRGTATYVFCRTCGTVAKCPQCDTPLTYHIEGLSDLRCHRCGYTRKMPEKCPHCQSDQMRAYGLGSEKVETEAAALFPSARVLRWDWETTRQKDAHEIILSHFAAHRADILVGTQMLAKGLDLPLVTLVGIVLADVGLNLPDPFAAERSFSLLTQVAGRAGRSALGGRVVMQTFQPEHYAIQAASHHDYAGFYTYELAERRKLGYPPFSRLVRLEYRALDAIKAENEARALAARLAVEIQAENRLQTDMIGPVPCFFSKVGGWYRWQVVVRGPDPVSLLQKKPLPGWRVEVDPVSLL